MKKNGAATARFGIGRGIVADKKLESMGRIFLAHLVKEMIYGKRFLGGENEMTVVVQGCGVLDPEISLGHTVIPPPGKGKPVGIPIKNRSKQKSS